MIGHGSGSPLRLLFLSAEHASGKGTGGIGSYVDTMSRALAARGHDVGVLSCLADAAPSDVVCEGVARHVRPLLRVRGLPRVVRGEQSRKRVILALSNYWHGRSLGRFDAVEAPDWQAEGLLFALLGHPLVTHLHTPHALLQKYNEYEFNRDSKRADWLERLTVRHSPIVTCPSQLLVDELRSRRWLSTRSVPIIRYPVDWRRFDALCDRSETIPRVLVVGRIERRKAPERVVMALAKLRGQGVLAEAVFVGRGSGKRDGLAYDDWLLRRAFEAGVPCRFVGELMWRDLPRRYAGSRVVCIPSEFESFSMAAVEAMAASKPVVLSTRVGAGELLAEGAPGQVCAMDAESLAQTLRPFLIDAELAARVGGLNRDLVARLCDPDEIARGREELYRKFPSARRNRRTTYVPRE